MNNSKRTHRNETILESNMQVKSINPVKHMNNISLGGEGRYVIHDAVLHVK